MIDIEAEAWKRFPSEELGTKGMIDASKRKMFIEGAEWYKSEILKKFETGLDYFKISFYDAIYPDGPEEIYREEVEDETSN